MNKILFTFFAVCLSSLLNAQLMPQDTFFSGNLPDNGRYVRTRAITDELTVRYKIASGWQSAFMTPLNDGYNVYQTLIPATVYPYLGFKAVSPVGTDVLPAYYNGTSMPVLGDLTPLVTDPSGDQAFTQTNLDLLSAQAAFSNDKLYFGLTNSTGTFPTGSGLTFFAYMVAIVNPDADSTANTTVYGLMHTVNISGVISPGLYKITGTSFSDLTLIGQIQTFVDSASNTLILSCNIADLLADDEFMSWYDVNNPRFGFMGITNKITLTGGTQTADQTSPVNIIPYPVSIPDAPSTLPVLSNISIMDEPGTTLNVSVDYFSSEAYLAVTSEVVFDNEYTQILNPIDFPDFTNPVSYTCMIDYSQIAGWSSGEIRFSNDQQQYATYQFFPVSTDDNTLNGEGNLVPHVYPNPAIDRISLDTKHLSEIQQISLYDIKGRLIRHIVSDSKTKTYTFDVSDVLPGHHASGIYILNVRTSKGRFPIKLCLIKK